MTRQLFELPGRDDDALERFLVENRDEIAAKLEEAQADIVAGRVALLEPLPKLLRDARRYAKARLRSP